MKKIVVLMALMCACAMPGKTQEKMDLKTLLARHAQSLKKADAPALQSFRATGSVVMNVLVGGSGTLAGTMELLSEGDHRRFAMNFGHVSYDHELVITDGNKISVDQVNTARRSDLGNFLLTQDQIFKEGIFGGTLAAGWPLADGAEGKIKLKYEGLKKVDGRDLHAVSCKTRRKGGDVNLTLFFDPTSFNHVKTVYVVTQSAGIGEGGETASARQHVTRLRLEEDFSDFSSVGGYQVPATWKIRYATESEQSRVWEWLIKITDVKGNLPVEAKAFEVK